MSKIIILWDFQEHNMGKSPYIKARQVLRAMRFYSQYGEIPVSHDASRYESYLSSRVLKQLNYNSSVQSSFI